MKRARLWAFQPLLGRTEYPRRYTTNEAKHPKPKGYCCEPMQVRERVGMVSWSEQQNTWALQLAGGEYLILDHCSSCGFQWRWSYDRLHRLALEAGVPAGEVHELLQDLEDVL